MATLSDSELRRLLANTRVIALKRPSSLGQRLGSVGGNIACWNWVFFAGGGSPDAASSPEKLYAGLRPGDTPTVDNLYLKEGELDALLTIYVDAASEQEKKNGEFEERKKFMQAMAKITARANGFQIDSSGQSHYNIYVTVPDHQWYSWNHWALGFSIEGQTIYVQKDTGTDVYADTEFWESNRQNYITTSIGISGILDGHRSLILQGLASQRRLSVHEAPSEPRRERSGSFCSRQLRLSYLSQQEAATRSWRAEPARPIPLR